jgi:hypothetical protein
MVLILVTRRFKAEGHFAIYMMVAVSSIYMISSYRSYSVLLQPHMDMRVNNFNKGIYWAFGKPADETQKVISEAISLGVYVPPARPHPERDVIVLGVRERPSASD